LVAIKVRDHVLVQDQARSVRRSLPDPEAESRPCSWRFRASAMSSEQDSNSLLWGLGLIGGDNGRLRANVGLFLLGWVVSARNVCAICTTEFHMSNPFHVSATLQHRLMDIFPRWSGSSSVAEAGTQGTKLTHEETTVQKIKSLFGIRNRMPRRFLLADYYTRGLTS
jgi:hypothetical protein